MLIVENVHCLKGKVSNIYVLNDETMTIVDSGCCPEDGEMVIEYLQQELGRSTDGIGLILLTHGHPDHMGGASYLSRESGAPVAKCPSGGNEVIQWAKVVKNMFTRQHLEMVYKMYRKAGNRLIPRVTNIQANRTVRDGDLVPGSNNWRILHTPGHSYDSICVYNETAQALISGDTIVSIASTPRPSPIRVSPELFEVSMERIASLHIKHLLPGHGQPLSGGDLGYLLSSRKKGA